MEAIGLDIHGIKCDACDYNNPDVKVEDYKDWLNKPCPKCGENLLTEEDYNNVQMILQIVGMANEVLPDRVPNEKTVTMSVEMNGTGDMNLKLK